MADLKEVSVLKRRIENLRSEKTRLSTVIEMNRESLVELIGTGDVRQAVGIIAEMKEDITDLEQRADTIMEELCEILPRD